MTFDEQLRELVREVVREELRAQVAPAAGDEYLSCLAAAAVAGVHTDTLRRWIREGKLAEHRAGRHVRVRRVDLERLMRGQRHDDEHMTPEEMARRDYR